MAAVLQAYQKLGRYRLESEIASGGMAVVYLARLMGAAGFSKLFALKKILPQWSQDPQFVDMLVNEAKILTRLKHPGIVEVFELGCEGTTHFIVMEYVDGLNLRELIRKLEKQAVKLPYRSAVEIVSRICAALHYTHSHKNNRGEPEPIIHRDISPQNILISHTGEIKITDFGIAKITGLRQNTQTGVLKGKFSYMSPEQAKGLSLTPRSDIFATGLLLYELLTGKKYFTGSNDLEILNRVREAKIIIPNTLPAAFKKILKLSLHPHFDKRYGSIMQMKVDLEACLNQEICGPQNMTLSDFMSHLENGSLTPDTETPTCIQGQQAATVIHAKTQMLTPSRVVPKEQASIAPKTIFIKPTAHALPPRQRRPHVFTISLCVTLGIMILLLSAGGLLPTQKIPPITILATNVIQIKPPPQLKNQHRPLIPSPAPLPELPPSPLSVFTKKSELPKVLPGFLSVVTRPFAVAKLNQNAKQETPAFFKGVPAGEHVLSLYFPSEKKSLSKTVSIRANLTTRCRASFRGTPILTCQ